MPNIATIYVYTYVDVQLLAQLVVDLQLLPVMNVPPLQGRPIIFGPVL